MRLQLSTWPEIEDYLTRSTGIIIPIGSTEQHGPSGFIGTDAICPETIALGVAERAGALVAPTLSIGMAQHHLDFPGSISLRPSTLMAVVKDVVQSLAKHGFTRCYFLNGHGGNIATVTAAFSEVYADSSFSAEKRNSDSVRCKLANWFAGPSVRELSASLYAAAEGSHATPSEIALSFFAHPEAAKDVQLTQGAAPSGTFYDSADYRSRFSDGRIGSDPSLVRPEHGKKLYDASVNDIVADYQNFLAAK